VVEVRTPIKDVRNHPVVAHQAEALVERLLHALHDVDGQVVAALGKEMLKKRGREAMGHSMGIGRDQRTVAVFPHLILQPEVEAEFVDGGIEPVEHRTSHSNELTVLSGGDDYRRVLERDLRRSPPRRCCCARRTQRAPEARRRD
jgi:hypothetical protein